MSEAPRRSDEDNRIIAAAANRRWREAGMPADTELDDWLEAEALLQQRGRIPPMPITLPIDITFRAQGVVDPVPKLQIQVPLPKDGATLQLVAIENHFRMGTEEYLSPNLLAHESRLVALQTASIAHELDRIARFADWICEHVGALPTPMFEMNSETFGKYYVLDPRFVKALFSPGLWPSVIAEIDAMIVNHQVSRRVAFDIIGMSLGSRLTIFGRLKAFGWKAALVLLAINGGHIALEVGNEILATAVVDEVKHIYEIGGHDIRPGVEGKIEFRIPQEQMDFLSTVSRNRNAEQR